MKELTIEEKAKAYDEALDICRKLYNKARADGYTSDMKDYEQIFPELKESDDERIRKVLLNDFKNNCSEYYCEGVNRDMIIAWLERQAQKPAWSEEDERMYRGLHNLIYSTPYCDSRKELSDWLESIKDRVQPQTKQEWSKEDATHYNRILKELNLQKEMPINASVIEEVKSDIIWFKSLRPQNTWKPSVFHLECISDAIAIYEERSINAIGLKEILEELKKLREELL